MGKRAVLTVSERKIDMCAYKEQYPNGRQPNIANNFSLLCGKCIS
jgi:hypothetical protein